MGLFYKLCLSQCLAGWSDIMCGNNLNVGHVTQAFHPNIFSYFRMLVGTIDFYYFVPFSMTLALSGGHKVSTKHSVLAPFFHPLLNWSRLNWMLSWSYSSRISWYYRIGCCLEAIQVEHPDTTFEWDLMKKGKQLLFYWLPRKTEMLAYIQIFMNWFGPDLVR